MPCILSSPPKLLVQIALLRPRALTLCVNNPTIGVVGAHTLARIMHGQAARRNTAAKSKLLRSYQQAKDLERIMKIFQQKGLYNVKGKVLSREDFRLFSDEPNYEFNPKRFEKTVASAEAMLKATHNKFKSLPINLLELALCFIISIPECPPSNPFISTNP